MLHLKELNFQTSENVAQTLMKWREQFTLFLIATGAAEKREKGKLPSYLTYIGERDRKIYSTFDFENEQMKYNQETVIEKFNNYCQPRKNLPFLTRRFFACKQKDHQRFDDYDTKLRSKVNQYEFGEISNRLIKDMLVCGLRDYALRERMLREPNLTPEKAIKAEKVQKK